MKTTYIPIAMGLALIFMLHSRAHSAENEFQDAELTGVVTNDNSGEYLYSNGHRYQMMFTDPEQKSEALDLSGQRVRVDGQIDRGSNQNLFWVDRVIRIEPIPEHGWGTVHLEPHGYVNPADDQPRGDPHFRGADVLDLPFKGSENDTIVPKLHLSW
jgi:hypothetical protein